MKNSRKGQSALEYLMTYGWGLLVIVLVVGALIFLINPTQIGGSSCTGFQSLPIGNFQFSTTGLSFNVTNQTARNLNQVQFAGKFTQGGTNYYIQNNNVTLSSNVQQNVTIFLTLPEFLASGPVSADLNVLYFDGDFWKTGRATCKGTI